MSDGYSVAVLGATGLVGRTMLQVEIMAAAGYGKHSTSQHLAKLVRLGLVERPMGPRGGYALTSRGEDHLDRLG